MKPTVLFQLFLLLFVVPNLHSQITTSDPEIFKMVNEVKTENLEAIVKKLVSFGWHQMFEDKTTYTCLLIIQNIESDTFKYIEVENLIDKFIKRD